MHKQMGVFGRRPGTEEVVCMSEGREGRNLKRREAMKKWKAVLAVFLSVVLVLQSSNIQAFADVIVGDGESGREEIVLDKPAEETEPSEPVDEQKDTPPASEPKKEEPAEPAEPATPEEPAEKKDEPAEKTEPVEKAEETKPAETTEPSKETSNSTAEEPSSPETEDTTATLKFDVTGATLTYNQDGEKNVTADTADKTAKVETTQDFKFTVTPDDGQQIASVKAVTSDGAESDVAANDNGEYTLAADNVTDGTTIKVTTEAVPELETPAEEETTETEVNAADSVGGVVSSVMMLKASTPVNVQLRLYNTDNQVVKTIDYSFTSGNINATTAPSAVDVSDLAGYHFTDATVDDGQSRTEIKYVESQNGETFYAFIENPTYGVGLAEGEEIYFNYMADGNTVPVNVTTGGEDTVEGNAVDAAERATKGSDFSFNVSTARGYTAEVTVNGRPVESNTGVYTTSIAGNASSVEVSVEFVKAATVTFDPGAFNDHSLANLYDSGSPRFDFIGDSSQIQTQPVDDDGATFTFRFKTKTNANTWWIDSFEINGIYLNIPTERTRGASAQTILYPEENGMAACVATLTITDIEEVRSGSWPFYSYKYSYTYELTITGAREDITIDFANLNNPTWLEVVPTATDGVSFASYDGNNTLSKPYALNEAPWFTFAAESGYKKILPCSE